MRLMRLTPAMRRYFDDLGIKPKNVFARGCFAGRLGRETAARRAAAAGLGSRRQGPGPPQRRRPWSAITLIGFGKAAERLRLQRDFAARRQDRRRSPIAGRPGTFREDAWRIWTGSSFPAPRPSAGPRSFAPTAPSSTTARSAEVNRIVGESLALIGTPVRAEVPLGAAPALAALKESRPCSSPPPRPAGPHPRPTTKEDRARLCDLRSSGSTEGRGVSDRLRPAPRLERRPDAPHARDRAGPVLFF